MSSVVERLRQSPKGQLKYDRELDGKSVKEFLRKFVTSPALSGPHTERSPSHRVSFGLAPVDDDEAVTSIGQDQHEKGNLDSLEKECSVVLHNGHKSPSVEMKTESQTVPNPVDAKSSGCVRSPGLCSRGTGSPGSQTVDEMGDSCLRAEAGMCPQELSRHPDPGPVSQAVPSFSESEPKDNISQDISNKELMMSFAHTQRVIQNVEDVWDNLAKQRREKKLQEFKEHQSWLDTLELQQLSMVEQKHRQDFEQQQILMERKHHSRKQEVGQAVQKVKEAHHHCCLRQDAKLKAMERLEEQLKEEQIKREQALEQRLQEAKAMAQSIGATKVTLVSVLDSCPNKQHLSEAAEKTRLLVRKLAEQAETLVGNTDRNGPLEEIMVKLKHLQEQSQNALDFVNSLTADAEKKAKSAAEQAERQRQQTPPTQQPQGQTTAQPGQTTPPQSASSGEERTLVAVAKDYADNLKLLSQTDANLQPFVQNQQMKKVRFDLQRAVNTPINAISAVNSAHLRDKLLRLRSLLKGETVEVVGKQVTAQVVPLGVAFCKNLVAKMIARKADEQVSSNHESAFAIAAVAVGLWTEFPDVGELLMAHLQALCPYVLPFHPPPLSNQSSADFHRTLGYKVEEDGTIEQQDKYLRRMSGLMRLYAAILVTAPPQGPGRPHPHGLDYAWIWLARTLNQPPTPDVTATAIYDMLQVTGNFLLRAYRVQFVKLLYCLYRVYLPKLKAVAAGTGPVSRLETFLQTAMRNSAMIPEPEGYIPPRFWHS